MRKSVFKFSKIWIVLICIAFFFVGFLVGQRGNQYHGKTAYEWSKDYDKVWLDGVDLQLEVKTLEDQKQRNIATMSAKIAKLEEELAKKPNVVNVQSTPRSTICQTYNRGKSTEFIQCN